MFAIGCNVASRQDYEADGCYTVSVTQSAYEDFRLKGLILSSCDADALELNVHQTLANYVIGIDKKDLNSASKDLLSHFPDFDVPPIKNCLGSVELKIQGASALFTGRGSDSITVVKKLKSLLVGKGYTLDGIDSQIRILKNVTGSDMAKECESWSMEEFRGIFNRYRVRNI